MNRLWIAALLAAIIAAICITGNIVIDNYSTKIENAVNSAYEAAMSNDYEKAIEYSELAETVFVDAEDKISFFIHHQLIEDMGVAIAEIPPLAHKGDMSEVSSKCKASLILLTHIVDDENLTISNIF